MPKLKLAAVNRRAPKQLVAVRMSDENQKAAKMVAATTGRTLSSLLEYALMLYIKKNYPEAYKPGARLQIILEEAPTEPAT